MDKLLHYFSMKAVSEFADPWAVKYVEPAFNGDADAALNLCVALSNSKRGPVAITMWEAKVAVPAFRVFLESAWLHDHDCVIDAAGTRRRLAAMFRYAAFPLPEFIADTVRVWRGAAGVPIGVARKGYSWTLDLDTACWFAMRSGLRLGRPDGKPLVLVADVPRSVIALYTNERDESEVLLLRAPAANADGSRGEWQRRYEAYEARKNESNMALFDKSEAHA